MKKQLLTYRNWLPLVKTSSMQVMLVLCLNGIAFSEPLEVQQALEKKISLRSNNQEVKSVLNQLEKLADVRFVYSSNLIQSNRKVSANFNGETL